MTLEGSDPDALAAHHESLAEHLRDVRPELGTVVSENMWISGSSEALGEMVAWLLVNALPPDEFAQAVRALAPNGRTLWRNSGRNIWIAPCYTSGTLPPRLGQSLLRSDNRPRSGGKRPQHAGNTNELTGSIAQGWAVWRQISSKQQRLNWSGGQLIRWKAGSQCC